MGPTDLEIKDLQLAINFLSNAPTSDPLELPLNLSHLTEQDWGAIYQIVLDLEEEKQFSTLH